MDVPVVVIKVKYGDTLRRFNARIVDNELNLNMSELTEKIFSLFNFAPDAGIMLTYIDEDADLIALVDDDDLRDVVKQSLNPLRIIVKVNDEKNNTPFSDSTRTSSSRSPGVQLSFQNSNAIASEIVKAIPEPLLGTLVNLSNSLASKVSYSASGISPDVAEFINSFSKVGLPYLNQLSESQSRLGPSIQSVVPPLRVTTPETKNLNLPNVDVSPPWKVSSNGRSEKHSSGNDEISAGPQPEAVTKGTEVKVGGSMEASSSKAAGVNAVGGILSSSIGPEKTDYLHDSEAFHGKPRVMPASVGEKDKGKMIDECNLNEKFHLTFSDMPHGIIGTDDPMKGLSPDERTRCIFPTNSSLIPNPGPPQTASQMSSFSKSKSQNDGDGAIFHRGVRCDGCRMYPIAGPRFKSKVKVNYDLCSVCFTKMGNDSDYIIMDYPTYHPHVCLVKGFHDKHARGRCPAVQNAYKDSKTKSDGFKLDSRFIKDINILDGAVIAPLTPFTKIWRMRNNGTVMWPPRTQLVWIGGDKFSNAFSVEVEVPAPGLAIGQELDVAVDFISPELPGRYISYWRMASPSGQKFGQRVWVLVQVDAAFKERQHGVQGLNLNLPPANNVLDGPETINVDLSPLLEGEPDHAKRTLEVVDTVVQQQQADIEQERKFPITDSLLVGSNATSSGPLAVPSYRYPFVDLSEIASQAFSLPPSPLTPLLLPSPINARPLYPPLTPVPPLPPPSPLTPLLLPSPLTPLLLPSPINARPLYPPLTPVPPPPSAFYPLVPPIEHTRAYTEDLSKKEEVEKKLLRDLEEMGFKQVDLNKEILRIHDYNLEQAVDDLCEVSEWDPILEDLKEMRGTRNF